MNDNPKLIKNGGEGTNVGKWLRTIGRSDILEKAVNIVGDVATGDWLGAVKTLISKDENITIQQQVEANRLIELDMAEAKEITKRWESDNLSDSWLSKNVRPMALIFLTVSMALYIIIDSSVAGFDVKEQWIELLSSLLLLIYAAYFGGRSLEKIQSIRKK
jgi:hypothetical protein